MALHLLHSSRVHTRVNRQSVTTVRAWVTDGEAVWTILACQVGSEDYALVLDEDGRPDARPSKVALPSGRVISAGWLAAYRNLTAPDGSLGTTIDLEA